MCSHRDGCRERKAMGKRERGVQQIPQRERKSAQGVQKKRVDLKKEQKKKKHTYCLLFFFFILNILLKKKRHVRSVTVTLPEVERWHRARPLCKLIGWCNLGRKKARCKYVNHRRRMRTTHSAQYCGKSCVFAVSVLLFCTTKTCLQQRLYGNWSAHVRQAGRFLTTETYGGHQLVADCICRSQHDLRHRHMFLR